MSSTDSRWSTTNGPARADTAVRSGVTSRGAGIRRRDRPRHVAATRGTNVFIRRKVTVHEGVLDGVKVLEVAEHGFVPSAAAILAEWGADVVKVERPTGDPLRQIMAMGFVADTGDFNCLFEQFNRNKRGVAIDLRNDEGRAALDRLIAWADVYITNFLPSARNEAATRSRRHLGREPAMRVRDRFGAGTRGTRRRPGRLRRGVVLGARRARAHAHARRARRWCSRAARSATRRAARISRAASRPRCSSGSAPANRRVVDVSLLGAAVWTLSNDLVPTTILRRRAAAARRGQERWQRARRLVPHRRRPLAQPEHARSRAALGADVPRARARRAARRSRVRDGRAARRARARAAPDLRRTHRRRSRSPSSRTRLSARGHDLLRDRIAGRGRSTIRRCIANGYLARTSGHPTARLASSPMQFDGQGLEIRRGCAGDRRAHRRGVPRGRHRRRRDRHACSENGALA